MTPARVPGDLKFVTLTVGAEHMCALAQKGAAYCWGFDLDGQLGIGVADSVLHVMPTRVGEHDPHSGGSAFAVRVER